MNKDITIRKNPSDVQILREASEQPLLTIEEEIELANRIKRGDEEALRKLITCNMRYVVSIAKQYQDRGLSLEELIEAGNKGLEQAAKKFNPEHGFKFIAYAVWFIKASILARLNIKDSDKEPSDFTDEEKKEIVNKLSDEREKAILTKWLGLGHTTESFSEISSV